MSGYLLLAYLESVLFLLSVFFDSFHIVRGGKPYNAFYGVCESCFVYFPVHKRNFTTFNAPCGLNDNFVAHFHVIVFWVEVVYLANAFKAYSDYF